MTDDELQVIRKRWSKYRSVLSPHARFFAAQASEDIPNLLDEVDRLREENRKLYALIGGAAT